MHLTQEIKQWRGPDVVLDCPACGERAVKASSYDEQIQDRYLGFLTLKVTWSTWVVCPECRARLSSKVEAADLEGKSRDELAELVSLRASFLQEALALIALGVAIFPLVGQVMAIIAVVANRNSHGWPKHVSFVALVVAILIAVLIVLLGVMVELRR